MNTDIKGGQRDSEAERVRVRERERKRVEEIRIIMGTEDRDSLGSEIIPYCMRSKG
jgi:hypothetical protein